jgi:hypothetical protein
MHVFVCVLAVSWLLFVGVFVFAQQAVRNKNFGWMEEQQATVNLQVRKGRGLAGGGSNIKKSAAAVLKSGRRQT